MKRYNVKISKRVNSAQSKHAVLAIQPKDTDLDRFYSLLKRYAELQEYAKDTAFNPFHNRLHSLISKLS